MFEMLVIVGVLALAGALVIGAIKLLLGLVILPFKLAFWVLKGVLVLLLAVPIVMIALNVVAAGIPILLFILVLPFLLLFAGLAFVFRLIF